MFRTGYFDFNKDFLIGVFATFLSYFIILQQFHPYFDKMEDKDLSAYETRARIGIFLTRLEGLADCHWVNPETKYIEPSNCTK